MSIMDHQASTSNINFIPTTPTNSSNSSSTRLINFKHNWTICEYGQVDEHHLASECLRSSQFYSTADNRTRFVMTLYPKGHDDVYHFSEQSTDHTDQIWLSLYLKCVSLDVAPGDDDETEGLSFNFKVAIVSETGELVNLCGNQSKFTQGSSYGFDKFINRKDLFSGGNKFLPKQKLTLHCEISYILNESIQSTTFELHQAAQRQIISNLTSLWQSRTDFDTLFKTSDGVIVKAHRCLLVSASKAFEKLIKQKLDTNVQWYNETVLLPDVESAVLNEVLCFIYTGRVQLLDKYKLALLYAAEKFQLDLLRSICANHIRASLPPDVAHQILVRMPLAIMPDVCLLAIFDYIPLRTLFQLTKVCAQWRKLLIPACARRTNLTVLVGSKDSRTLLMKPTLFDIPFQEDLLNSQGLLPTSPLADVSLVELSSFFIYKEVPFLIDKFPNVTHLKVVISDTTELALTSLEYLLSEYKDKLISLNLKLSLNRILPPQIESHNRLIGTMRSLTHLSMQYDNIVHLDEETPTRILPPMPQSLQELIYFSIYRFDYEIFVQTVHQNMPNLQRIAISERPLGTSRPIFFDSIAEGSQTNAVHSLRPFIPIGPRIINFGRPIIYNNRNNINNPDAKGLVSALTNFVPIFNSLTSIKLCLGPESSLRAVLKLVPLTQLVHLEIQYRLSKSKEPPSITNSDSAQLASLKVLQLDLLNSSKLTLTPFNLGHTFPNIQVFTLKLDNVYLRCTNCDKSHYFTKNAFLCVYPVLQPLKQCRQLRKIYVKYSKENKFEEWTYPI